MGCFGSFSFAVAVVGLGVSFYSLHRRYGDLDRIDCREYHLAPAPKLQGALSVNNALEKADYILLNQIAGPESLIVEGDHIYATLADGRIVTIDKGVITRELRLTKEKNCGTFEKEPSCGRPLGIRRLNKDELIVADAYLGVFVINPNTAAVRRVLDSRVAIAGSLPRFLNDIDILNSDEVIVTDSSYKNDRRHFMNEILEGGGNGRVIKLCISTGEASVLLDGLHFANGIQILPDKKSFVVSELTRAKITRYWLESGKRTTFVENLPGLPDNIRLSSNGTLWVGLAGIRHADMKNTLDLIASYPRVRQLLLDTLPDPIMTGMLPRIKSPHALVAQLDLSGRLISTLHDVQRVKVGDVSQVTDSGDFLYMGSFHSPYIARLRKF